MNIIFLTQSGLKTVYYKVQLHYFDQTAVIDILIWDIKTIIEFDKNLMYIT